jgi:hypothetical protein
VGSSQVLLSTMHIHHQCWYLMRHMGKSSKHLITLNLSRRQYRRDLTSPKKSLSHLLPWRRQQVANTKTYQRLRRRWEAARLIGTLLQSSSMFVHVSCLECTEYASSQWSTAFGAASGAMPSASTSIPQLSPPLYPPPSSTPQTTSSLQRSVQQQPQSYPLTSTVPSLVRHQTAPQLPAFAAHVPPTPSFVTSSMWRDTVASTYDPGASKRRWDGGGDAFDFLLNNAQPKRRC